MSWAARFKLRLHLWCQVVKGVCECHCKPQTDYPETSDKFSGHTKWPHLLDCTFQLGGGWGFWGVFRLLVFLWEGRLHFRVIRLENLFEFFILEGDLHDCYLNFHQLLEQFYAFKPKHLEKCIFQGKKKKSSSLFIIRNTFHRSQTFYLPFKHEHRISSWLRGLLEFEAEVHKVHCQERRCHVIELSCSYLDQTPLLRFFHTEEGLSSRKSM